jgi:hypothetical protein
VDSARWNGGTLDSGACVPRSDETGPSGYDFDPVDGSPAYTFASPDALGQPFDLGTFTHLNQVVDAAITQITYNLGLTIGIDGIPHVLSTSLLFSHDETDNNGIVDPSDPNNRICEVGDPHNGGCDDLVTVSPVLNAVIQSGLDTYYFSLLGFSTDGGVNFTNVFQSPEQQNNSADLYAILTTEPFNPVPEPTTLVLLGTGLMGLATATRRRLRNRSRRNQN